jgi:hypothetical protein
MSRISRSFAAGLVLLSSLLAGSCGGGSSGSALTSGSGSAPAASNVVSVVVDDGPDPLSNPTANTLYTTVTVCVPGSTTECQTIDHIQVDTASDGLRILASVLTLSLNVAPAPDNNSLVECTPFADGYSWGPIAMVDFTIAGETASSLPIQLIGDARFAAVPAACSGLGKAEQTVAAFGANGVLGIGVFQQDCGSGCTAAAGAYYSCTQASCGAVTPTTQVLNPVPLFVKDNDGTIIVLPGVAAQGAATLSGSLIFGIDTESNNASGTQTILTLDPNFGEFTTIFNGVSLSTSIIDSGTNGISFNDNSIAQCSDGSGFYCPASTLNLSATLTGQNGVSYSESFSVANALTLQSNNPTFTAFPALAGVFSSDNTTFDWGLPFFYGRRVATAIEGQTTAVSTGPYVAF